MSVFRNHATQLNKEKIYILSAIDILMGMKDWSKLLQIGFLIGYLIIYNIILFFLKEFVLTSYIIGFIGWIIFLLIFGYMHKNTNLFKSNSLIFYALILYVVLSFISAISIIIQFGDQAFPYLRMWLVTSTIVLVVLIVSLNLLLAVLSSKKIKSKPLWLQIGLGLGLSMTLFVSILGFFGELIFNNKNPVSLEHFLLVIVCFIAFFIIGALIGIFSSILGKVINH